MKKHFFGRFTSALALAVAATMSLGTLTACNDDDGNSGGGGDGGDDVHTVAFDKTWECYYFIAYEVGEPERYGNYFFELTTGAVGMDGMLSYPLNAGDYILDLDIYTALDPDHANPVLPEGTYRPGQREEGNVFSIQNTMAVYNSEKLDDGSSRIRYIRFSDGTITVTHTPDGYKIVCDMIAKEDGSKWLFTYEGPVPFEDKSGEEDGDWWGFHSDITIDPLRANLVKYDDSETTGCDQYIIRFFDTNLVTAEGNHPNGIGHKLQVTINTDHGHGLTGTYTPSSTDKANTFVIGERFASAATGSYVEKVRDDYSVRYELISDGKVTITAGSAPDTYNVNVDCTSPEGYTIKMQYTGTIQDITGVKPVYSTLTSDITVTPTQCSYADYYGDYYQNGTVNYGVALANRTEIIMFEFLSATGTATELPTGTFTIGSDPVAGTLVPGTINELEGQLSPTIYVKYNDDQNEVIGYAPAAGGQLTITKHGSDYTFTYDLEDDAEPAHHITGTATVSVPELEDYTQKGNTSSIRKRAATNDAIRIIR